MEFKTLEHTPIDNIRKVLNDIFMHHIIPFQMTPSQFERKIKTEDVQFDLSVGAFVEDKLVGFILHAKRVSKGEVIIYNAGTVVLPEYRGNSATKKMFRFILPTLKKIHVKRIYLDVLKVNECALHIYRTLDFVELRELKCYKGDIPKGEIPAHLDVRPLKVYDWELLSKLWDFHPCWLNDPASVENASGIHKSFGFYDKGELIAYLIYSLESNKISQFAVRKDYQGKGFGKLLFIQLGKELDHKEIRIIHVENKTGDFIASLGLNLYADKYEMMYEVK